MRPLFGGILLMAGCASAPSVEPRVLSHPLPGVLASFRVALRDHAEVQEEGNTIVTSWGKPRKTLQEQGYLFENRYEIRVKYRVELEAVAGGTAVRILAGVERRPPGGPRSLRWERIASDGSAEKSLFDEVALGLEPRKDP